MYMPRCPLNVISSPSGPWTMLTPGVSVSRSSNLRPRIGVVLIVVSLRVLLTSVRVMSMNDDPLTVTVSAVPETFKTGFERHGLANGQGHVLLHVCGEPRQSHCERISARRSCRNTKRPSPAVICVRKAFVSTCLTSTWPPGPGTALVGHGALDDAGRDLRLAPVGTATDMTTPTNIAIRRDIGPSNVLVGPEPPGYTCISWLLYARHAQDARAGDEDFSSDPEILKS